MLGFLISLQLCLVILYSCWGSTWVITNAVITEALSEASETGVRPTQAGPPLYFSCTVSPRTRPASAWSQGTCTCSHGQFRTLPAMWSVLCCLFRPHVEASNNREKRLTGCTGSKAEMLQKSVLLVTWQRVRLSVRNAWLLSNAVRGGQADGSVSLLTLHLTSASIFWPLNLVAGGWGKVPGENCCLTWEIRVLHISKAFVIISKLTFRKVSPRLTARDTLESPKQLTKVGFHLCQLERGKFHLLALVFPLN